ncbi:sulfotransferase family 2 domain-containing protein [Ekhidna sp.]|uniref:sulfotransferase family 2 domain-containing protein n=1 Tax=Ekhidna sp. TaxID=2608089 RepID=UPI003298EF88
MKQRKALNIAVEAKLWKYNYWHNEAVKYAQHIYSSDSIFSFIPKNASSTLRWSIAVDNGILDVDCDIKWTTKPPNSWIFNPTLYYQLKNNYTFVILRCPYSRLASSYLDQIVRKPHIYLTHWPKENILRTTLDPLMSRYVTFDRFVKKIRSNKNFLYGNAHWIPQFRFLLYDDYDDYFCVEEFGKVVDTLREKIGFKVYDTRKRLNHGIDSLKKIEVPNPHKLNAKELLEMKNNGEIVNPKSLFTDEHIEIVKNLYAEDIDLYRSKFGEKNLMFPDTL